MLWLPKLLSPLFPHFCALQSPDVFCVSRLQTVHQQSGGLTADPQSPLTPETIIINFPPFLFSFTSFYAIPTSFRSSSSFASQPMDSSIQSQPHGLQPDLSKPSSISFNPSLHQINSASSMVLDTDTETVELKAWLARNPTRPFPILRLPTTIILHIFARLDLPDLDSLRSAGNPMLSVLAADSVLHQQRLRAVGTTCLEPYFLKRPTRLELAKSWKLKGLNMEAKIIRGSYLHSPSSIKHFENSQRFTRSMICHKLTKALSARPVLWQLTTSNLIDEELQTVSAALAPTIRLLKRELAKDRLAQQMRYGPGICNSSYQHLLKHHS